MITSEEWLSDARARTETRRFFASDSGKLFLQLLYRMASVANGISQTNTPEMELGRTLGKREMLREIEGVALAVEKEPQPIEDDYNDQTDLER